MNSSSTLENVLKIRRFHKEKIEMLAKQENTIQADILKIVYCLLGKILDIKANEITITIRKGYFFDGKAKVCVCLNVKDGTFENFFFENSSVQEIYERLINGFDEYGINLRNVYGIKYRCEYDYKIKMRMLDITVI